MRVHNGSTVPLSNIEDIRVLLSFHCITVEVADLYSLEYLKNIKACI